MRGGVDRVLRFVVVRGALPAHPGRVITLALPVVQASTARRSEIWAPENHVGADPRSGVNPTEPGDPGGQIRGTAGTWRGKGPGESRGADRHARAASEICVHWEEV